MLDPRERTVKLVSLDCLVILGRLGVPVKLDLRVNKDLKDPLACKEVQD